jgi:hypothetical protein
MPTPKYELGTILRYSSGPTALFRVDAVSPNHGGAVRYYGQHCLGGMEGRYESQCESASADDLRMWVSQEAGRNNTNRRSSTPSERHAQDTDDVPWSENGDAQCPECKGDRDATSTTACCNSPLPAAPPSPAEVEDSQREWPWRDVLCTLADFADDRLSRRDYDGHRHEVLRICVTRAREILTGSQQSTPPVESVENGLPYKAVSVNGRALEWKVPLWDAIVRWATARNQNDKAVHAVAVENAVEAAMLLAIECRSHLTAPAQPEESTDV